MVEQIVKNFIDRYNKEPLLIKSPARINLIGEHVDYSNGMVMPATIDKCMYFAFAKNDSNIINIRSENFDNQFSFNLENLTVQEEGSWGVYIQAIIELILEEPYKLSGMDCIMLGDIPIGAGLSSSAALCCGFLSALNHLNELGIGQFELALLAQNAENRIGLNCGLMDQYAVVFGKKNKFIHLDCKNLTHQYLDLDLGNCELVLIDSKIEHDLKSESFYNNKRLACESATETIKQKYPKVNSLRDVDSNTLETMINDLTQEEYISASFVINENKRVKEVANAIANKDLNTIGEKLYETHWGLSKQYGVSTDKMDSLIKYTECEPDILGARMMGGGFGGCTLNLIAKQNKEEVLDRVVQKYFKNTSMQAKIYYIALDDGMDIINL